MWIRTITTPGIALHSYVVGDSITQQAVVIDPSRDVQPILALLQHEKLQVHAILETHVHTDFISGAFELQQRLKEHPPIMCSAMAGPEWVPSYATTQVQQADVIECGHMRFEALHTPGHTPEHVTWLLYDLERSGLVPYAAFTGDCLFAGSVGRPDLLGQEALRSMLTALRQSLFVTFKPLPDSLLIYPAHGKGSLCGKHLTESGVTTLGYERMLNPYLQEGNEEAWNQEMLESLPKIPMLFSSIKTQNRSTPALMQQLPKPEAVSFQQLLHLEENVQCFDVRAPLLFAFGHVPGCINVPLTHQFAYWMTQLRNPELPLYLIATDDKELQRGMEQLALIGIENIAGYLLLDHRTAEAEIGSLIATPTLSSAWVEHLLTQQADHFCLLDVRFEHERQAACIPGSIGIPLQELLKDTQKVPKNMPITVLCRTGSRSSIAASFLQKLGFKEVSVLLGGMEAWKEAGLPIEGFLQQHALSKDLL